MKHSKQLIHVVFVLVLVLLTSTESAAQTMRILPLGNSITEGTYTISTPAEGVKIAYRYTLYNLLTSAGYNFNFVGHMNTGYEVFSDSEHGGIPGTRDEYLVRLLQDGYDQRWGVQTTGGQPYLDVYPADLILLHIGTNDITHDEGASPGSVSQILDEIDAWEARTGTEVTVIVARILNRTDDSDLTLTTTQFNNNVAAMVAARNDESITLVDIESGAGIDYFNELQADGIHPTASSYAKMGEKWFEAIQALNKAPYFTSDPVTTSEEDVLYSYTIVAADENPLDNLTLYSISKPDWCSFTDNGDDTGLLSGIPGDSDVGTHSVSLIVSDGKTLETQDFTITVGNVNDPPVIIAQQSISTNEDSPIILTKSDFTIEDSDSPAADLELIVYEGDNYSFQGTTVTPDKDFNGTLKVNVKASDQIAESPTVFLATVLVNPVNDPPEIFGQKSIVEVKQFESLELLATDFNYVDVDNNIVDITVFVSSDPDALFQVNGNSITPVKDTSGIVELGIVLNDGEDLSEEFSFQVEILPAHNPPYFTTTPPEPAVVGSPYFYVVGATDPDEGDELNYRSTTLPSWLKFNSSLKLLGGSPSAEDTGTVWVGLEVTDGMFYVEQLYQLEVKMLTSSGINGGLQETQASGSGLIRQIYPVPAGDVIHLSLYQVDNYVMQILDISGRVLIQSDTDAQNRSEMDIHLEGFKPGIYFIRVFTGKSSDSKKFMIR